MNKWNKFWRLFGQWLRILVKQAARPLGPNAIAIEARLYAKHFDGDGKLIKDHGLISTKVVTDAFVAFLVDNLQTETAEVGDCKFHDSGTGVVAENVTDTDLGTKVESGRATGSQGEGASANIYQTVGTITYTAGRAITEHGVFTIAAAGTLVDRSVFSAINVVNTDQIQFTYELTFPAGG